ncbi:MAG: acyltransferase domain-containing protein, partial [Panacagrimonas sp.]
GRTELLLLGAVSAPELASRARQALAHLCGPAPLTLEEVAAGCAKLAKGTHRLALVAGDEAELQKQLEDVIAKLEAPGCKPFRTRGGVHYGVSEAPGKLCFLFPGEGSQYPGMLADLCVSFPLVREWFDVIEQNARARGAESRAAILYPAPTMVDDQTRQQLERRLFDMDVATESVFAASLGLYSLFADLGFTPDGLLGHSTGENTALAVWTRGTQEHRERVLGAIQALGAIYRQLDAGGQILSGTLLTVGALKPAVHAALLADSGEMVVAMDNCPNQLVLFGTPEAAARLQERLTAEGAVCAALPFGRAYHTPAFHPMAEAILTYYSSLEIATPLEAVDLYSACSAGRFPRDAAGICALTARQWESPVRFTRAVRQLYADGYRVFVELGPSGNLTSFVGDILRREKDVLALSSNSRRKDAVGQLHATLAQLHAAGVPFDAERLFAHRAIQVPDLLGAARAPGRTPQTLKLRMPTVTLPEKFARPLPVTTAPALPSTTPAPALDTPAPSADPRSAALQAHFTLMQEFLASQARVMGLVPTARGATAAAPTLLSSLAAASPIDPDFPLLGRSPSIQDGRLVVERSFDLAHDLFLLDHAIGAQPSSRDLSLRPLSVIPFTFSMELIAEAAVRLDGRSGRVVTAIENARGSRWLSLDDGQIRLKVVAQRADADSAVACRVFLLGESGPADGLLVFEGLVQLADAHPTAPPAAASAVSAGEPPRWHTAGQIYRHGMFHGPRLQGCTEVRSWGAQGMDATLEALPTRDYFAGVATPRYQFDAALLDAAGQLAGFWLRERHEEVRNCFPFRVRSLQLFAPPPPAGTPVECRGRIRMDGETQLEAQWDLMDRQGRLLMRAQGWEDRVFTVPDRFAAFRANPSTAPLSDPALADRLPQELHVRHLLPLPAGLLEDGGGIWMRVVAHMCLSADELRDFAQLPARGPRREEWLIGRLVVKDAARDWYHRRNGIQLAPADVEILADAQGRPFVRCRAAAIAPPAVSLTHSRGHACAIAGDPGLNLGLDYQRLENLRLDALIQGALVPEEHPFLAVDHPTERLRRAVALWTAKEAAAKASGTGLLGRPRDWVVTAARLDRRAGEPTVARVRHDGRAYDIALHFDPDGGGVFALCIAPSEAIAPIAVPTTATST